MTQLFAEQAAQPATDALVRDVGMANFVKDVLEESKTRLVIVDFWAPWCGPCKQLIPLLEKTVRALNGAAVLAKVNSDENQQLAQQLHVQSVPTVFAFFQGQPVDGFMGAQPESQLKAWLDKLVKATGSRAPGAEDYTAALAQAAAWMAEGDAAKAQALYADILAEQPGHPEALAGLFQTFVAQGRLDDVEAQLAALPPDLAGHKAFASVRAALDLARQAGQAGDTAALEARLAENPNDHQARFDLAMAAYAAGERERAVDALLEIVARDRAWQEDGARKQLVKFFEAFGATDPLTLAARRRLSSLLFS